MLGAAVLAGAVGIGSTPARAAEFGIYMGTQAAYAPPCPGPGYVWVRPIDLAAVGIRDAGTSSDTVAGTAITTAITTTTTGPGTGIATMIAIVGRNRL